MVPLLFESIPFNDDNKSANICKSFVVFKNQLDNVTRKVSNLTGTVCSLTYPILKQLDQCKHVITAVMRPEFQKWGLVGPWFSKMKLTLQNIGLMIFVSCHFVKSGIN